MSDTILFETTDTAEWATVESVWTELLAAGAESSFFLSWPAIATWLEHQAGSHRPRLLVGRHAEQPMVACFISSERFVRHRLLRGRRLHLNGVPPPHGNLLFMEQNDVLLSPLVDPSHALTAMFRHLRLNWDEPWDELVIPGVSEHSRLGRYLKAHTVEGLRLESQIERPAPLVELTRLAAPTIDAYLAALSANTRSQLRRSLRCYRSRGTLTFEVAQTIEQALSIFDELWPLHQSRWTQRGESGSFHSKAILAFHRALIRRCFPEKSVQLSKLTCEGQTIGCLYCFVHRGIVGYYSSGFAYADDSKQRPGLTTHFFAIQHCLEQGYLGYDFLAGAARYKSSLSNSCSSVSWYRLWRPRLSLRLEQRLRRLKQRVSARR